MKTRIGFTGIALVMLSLLLVSCAPEAQVPTNTPPPPAPPALLTATPKPLPTPMIRPIGAWYIAGYDPLTKRIILVSASFEVNDVWGYDVSANQWTQLASKKAGYSNSIVADEKAGWISVFYQWSIQLWAYLPDENAWKQLESPPNVVEDSWARMVYAPERGAIYLYASTRSLTISTVHILIYDSTNDQWTDLPKENGPFNNNQIPGYDQESSRIIVWDGLSEKLVWAFDVNTQTWEKLPYSEGPARGGTMCGVVYVPDVDRIFFYEGSAFWTYDYNNKRWEQAKGGVKPGARYNPAVAYDPVVKKIFFYGGSDENVTQWYDDTWLYDPVTGEWAEVAIP